MTGSKRIEANFYKSYAGNEPVRAWLLGLSQDDRKTIGADVQVIEYGWGIVSFNNICTKLEANLYEVRSNISDQRIARVIFCIANQKMILLHAFIKKSQKTPKGDLETARQRQKEVIT